LREALAPYALKPWPYPGTIGVREISLTGERTELHVFGDWCWLGTARDESDLHAILEAPPRCTFDLDIYRLLVKHLPRATIRPLQRP
jgi:DNA polymerase III subunit epsilon